MSKELSVKLYFREGSSDKIYNAELKQQGSGYVVNFAYGRRGNSMTQGTKTNSPVSYEKALSVYQKLVKEKTGKGYTEDSNGTPFTSEMVEPEDTGWRPQLLNPIESSDVEFYISSPEWCAQEKFDGQRRLIILDDGKLSGANRKGQIGRAHV